MDESAVSRSSMLFFVTEFRFVRVAGIGMIKYYPAFVLSRRKSRLTEHSGRRGLNFEEDHDD